MFPVFCVVENNHAQELAIFFLEMTCVFARHLENRSPGICSTSVLPKLLSMWDHCLESRQLEDSMCDDSSFGSNGQHLFNVITLKTSTFIR